MLIREAVEDDAKGLIELERVLAEAGRGMVLSPEQVNTLEEERNRIASAKGNGATLGIVAEVDCVSPEGESRTSLRANSFDRRIVGSAFIKQLAPARCRHVGILSVGVHPDHQRTGIGRALMKHLIQHARASGLERLELYVRGDNAPAQALYVSLGFVQEGTRARFIKLEDGTYVDDFIFSRFLG